MSRRTIAVMVIAILAVGLGAFLLGGGQAPGTNPTASATLPPVPPSTSVVADARTVPVRSAKLAAPAGGGVVVETLVDAGAEVAAGAPLVRLDTEQADIEVASAQAALDAATAGAAQATAAAAQAVAQLEAAVAGVEQARAGVVAADAQRDGTPSGSSARRAANAEVDRARAALDAARAQRDASRSARDAATAAADGAAADVVRAEAALAASTAARDDLTIAAPFAGIVASLDARVGETVAPGAIVARVADPTGWRFETTDLDETSVGRIAEGASAIVSLDAFPDVDIEGRVASIAPFGDASAGDIVYVVVIEPTGTLPDGLRWNMTASATIDAAPAD